MNESVYRIENPLTGEAMEFYTFKAAYKRLTWLRRQEGAYCWPYKIANNKSGRSHTRLSELKRMDKFHLSGLWSRANMIMDAVDQLDDERRLHPTAINVYEFARDMKPRY